jgi:hypothetical protein
MSGVQLTTTVFISGNYANNTGFSISTLTDPLSAADLTGMALY